MGEVAENEDFNSLKPPFVGGAERARRNARKRMHRPRHQSHGTNANKRRGNGRNETVISPYPKSMREHERFLGSLLSSSPEALERSETDEGSRREVMQRACSLLNVPSLPSPLRQKLSASKNGDEYARTHHLIQRSSSLLSNASCASYASGASSSSSSAGTFDNARAYYMSNAPLILEESRCVVANSLAKAPSSNELEGATFDLELASTEEKYPNVASRQGRHAPLVLNFRIVEERRSAKDRRRGGRDEGRARWTRPGGVLLLRRSRRGDDDDGSPRSTPSVLACVVPNGNRNPSTRSSSSNRDDDDDDSSALSLMIFRRDDIDLGETSSSTDDARRNGETDKALFRATGLTTLISQTRQMEACLRMIKVSFMTKLLGHKGATHIRFDDGSDEEEGGEEELVGDVERSGLQEGFYVNEEGDDGRVDGAGDEEGVDDNGDGDESLLGLLERIPSLNQTQERAAKSFLDSPKESLILVQGPPGTGKSTFLVNVICRRLANDPNARLLVTAPTNRAVTVLAERFLDVVSGGDDDLSCKCRAVLIGVEDKLVSSSSSSSTRSSRDEAECISAEALSSRLRGIFAYTWTESLRDECASLSDEMRGLRSERRTFDETRDATLDSLVARAERVRTRVVWSIPSQRSIRDGAELLLEGLRATAAAANEREARASRLEEAVGRADDLAEALDGMESPVPELLATARVIFCTLSTAGSSALKRTRRIDDLLIDEAAAATEPEICIPFHLRPKRMLAVGDPLQLPPTIMSRRAADMGLSTSMHERLMNRCGKSFFMLDRQYRMNAQISSFPCGQFYDGGIANGKNVACTTYKSNIALPRMGPYSFVDVRGGERQVHGGSYANEAECAAVVDLVEEIRGRSARRVADWHSADRLRVITFYQGQATLLRRLLAGRGLGRVLVATVDSSQGCEADVVVLSFVRSSSRTGVRRAAGFLADDRRINVALTRARHQLICVGDATGTLGGEGSETLKNLVSDARRRGCLLNES